MSKHKLSDRSAWLLRYIYSLQPRAWYALRLPIDAPAGITWTNIRGLERARLVKNVATAALFEITEEGILWCNDNPA